MATSFEQQTQAEERASRQSVFYQNEAEISFASIFEVIARQKKKVVLPALYTGLLATAVAFLIPPQYTSETVILTPQQAQSSVSALSQISGAGSAGALSGLSLLAGFGLRNPSDLYVGILESRALADSLINRFDLKQVYGVKYYQSARKHLRRNTSIKAGKDTLIHIEVSDRDPKRAAELANAYVEELSKRDSTVTLTEASQRRLFFEEQLAKQRDLLADAEIALRNTQQTTGLMVPTGQAEALLRSTSQLHAEILSRQAQLAGMRVYAADDNPRYVMVKRQLEALQSELATLEKGEHVSGTPDVPVGKLPAVALEYIRKYRDVKYHETLYEVLAKQYEAARLDEAKSAPLVQVIDKALAPEKRSWPPRTIIILVSSFLAAIVSALILLMKKDPALQTANL